MAMWILRFLWILRVEYSGNTLYKPLCAFLVFVDLVWILCGRLCGFWSRVVFCSWSCHRCRCRLLRVLLSIGFVDLWIGGLARQIDADARGLRVHLLFVDC